ncbi:MAG: AAA family ATPase, partial [Oscillospiraceae bacterium]|nr:AAA family ATPase [Oscillospiraceae bacterium]
MRIISCYIENFGGLSHFSCDFNAGLTTIQQHNGFGKTTLAEYIRAMFYGFPRAGRTLEKNKRKRFKPWQGGKFGGNLVFEYEGTQYRIERTFGGSPATDTFAVYDLSTHKPCDKFSYDIGVDIFHLDADSFERSTYLPQLQDAPPMITDSIQAKLGELVDDTDDDNNFNHAVRALQAARSPLVPRKGQSGAQKKIAELEKFFADAGGRREELERLQTELAGKKKERDEKEDSRDALLEKISLASETAGQAAVQEQLDRLNAEYDQNEQAMTALREKYPDGLPSEEEIDALLLVYDDIAPLHARSVPSSAYETAKKNLEENARRFEHGVPTEADFQTYQGKYEEYTNKKAYLKNLSLTPQEQEKLVELETFFKAGVPDETFLVTCQQKQQELRAGKTESLNQCLPAAEQARLNALEQFFRNGVPSDDDLFGKQRELQRINQLKQENNVMALATAGAARQE